MAGGDGGGRVAARHGWGSRRAARSWFHRLLSLYMGPVRRAGAPAARPDVDGRGATPEALGHGYGDARRRLSYPSHERRARHGHRGLPLATGAEDRVAEVDGKGPDYRVGAVSARL